MANDGEDESIRWATKLKGGQSAPSGATKDLMRRARQINPALAAKGSTTELFNEMKSAESAPSPAKAKGAPTADLVTELDALQRWHRDEKNRIGHEIEALQRQAQQVTPAALEKLMDLILAIDPNMTSPQTQEMLRAQAPFLAEIGFSVRKLIDRKLKKKSGR
ncbi:MAG: hypothetical protein IT381_19235 [Deltaproteobacteria bacterium]|nr:hypothetical protein [Deltaproteobacteria bacterium]